MNRKFLAILIPVGLLAISYFYLYKNEKKFDSNNKIIVYTYSSFASSWGAGPEIQKLFKETTGADIEFIDVGEAGIILQRIQLEKEKTQADLVLGLDQYILDSAGVKDLFESNNIDASFSELLPKGQIKRDPFIAYNWSTMSFIYRPSDFTEAEKKSLPQKLDDFISPKFKNKIILFDPRTSTPGYIFLHWIVQVYGIEGAKEYLNKLKKNVYTVTPSWSAGYGLFKKKQSQFVFSYITSLAYHWIEELNLDFEALQFEEGLPYHIEYAGILKSSKNKPGSKKFLEFLLTQDAQKIIVEKNYMLPVLPVSQIMQGGETKLFEGLERQAADYFEVKEKVTREDVLNVWKSISW